MTQQAPVGTAPAQTFGLTMIKGRIRARRRSKRQGLQGFLTILALPAPDTYSMPQAVEVFSSKPVGELGDEITVRVLLGGYPRSYESTTEDEEGFKRKVTVQTADNTLTVIE